MRRREFIALWAGAFAAPRWLTAQHHVVSADPLVVESDLKSRTDPYTPVEDFYIRNHFDLPQAAGAAVLQVEGEVERPRSFSQADLTALPEREIAAVLECAGNLVGPMGLVSNGAWAGWPLAAVLTLVRPAPAAAHLHLFGRDGYSRSVALGRGLESGLLVTRLNQRPLTRQHGAPWRLLFPGSYGMDSVKWLQRISLSKDPLPALDNTYLEQLRGKTGDVSRRTLPRMQVKSVIVQPVEGAVLRRGSNPMRGLAWSGEGRVSSVEVSTDGGSNWRAARLEEAKDFGWTRWEADLKLNQPGPLELVCRAKDVKGFAQPAQRDPARLDGYANNWYHRVHCVVA